MSYVPPGPPGPPPPPPPQGAPPPVYQPPPGPQYQPPPAAPTPPGSPGYMPQPIGPTSGSGLNIGLQVAGAGWSIALGAVGILVPIVTALFMNGTVFYFYLLPIFGLVYGARAIGRGFLIGGIIGIVLNLIAGLVSLTAAGIINPGG